MSSPTALTDQARKEFEEAMRQGHSPVDTSKSQLPADGKDQDKTRKNQGRETAPSVNLEPLENELKNDPSSPVYGSEACAAIVRACNGTFGNDEDRVMRILSEVAAAGKMNELDRAMYLAAGTGNKGIKEYISQEFDGEDKAQALLLIDGHLTAGLARSMKSDLGDGKFEKFLSKLERARAQGTLESAVSDYEGIAGKSIATKLEELRRYGVISGAEEDKALEIIAPRNIANRAQSFLEGAHEAIDGLKSKNSDSTQQGAQRAINALKGLSETELRALDAELKSRSPNISVESVLQRINVNAINIDREVETALNADEKSKATASQKQGQITGAEQQKSEVAAPAVAGPAQVTKLPGGQIVAKEGAVQHLIQKDETLSHLAVKWGTTVDEIMAANPHIKHKDRVYAGVTVVACPAGEVIPEGKAA